MKDMEKCLDSQFWHACAGGMVQMPPVNSKVYYFPQGQAEHANSSVDFGSFPKIPAFVLCRVAAMKFLADHDTDEVYVKIRLEPIKNGESDFEEENGILHSVGSDIPEKPASFAKTLTQSDANNGGGFSVPRYCAEMIFPRLDYSADPPVQTVLAKDVHGEIWKFRHIYRGTPRRHLLTTGWSSFVNQKKLMAGDSIVFLRAESGDLCIGIRRAKRGIDGGSEIQSGWNSSAGNCMSPYGGSSIFLREEECKFTRARNSRNMNTNGGFQTKGKVRAESVLEAALLAANGQPFEVAYYPRASTPEFCVKASNVVAAMRIQWCSGMRFKMAFETEDSSRISWFMGTISSVQVTDPIRWPNSPWRLLQVTWDEPDLLQNVKRVSPWLVELVSTIPSILAPFSPPRKKLRPLPNTDLFHDDQVSLSNNPLGIQGARHHLFDTSLTDFQFNKLKSGLFLDGFHQFSPSIPPSQVPTNVIVGNSVVQDSVSCMPKTGNSQDCMNNSNAVKAPCFLLFGQPILTEEQISLSSSETVSTILMGNNSPNGNQDRTASSSSPEKSFDRIPRNMDLHAIEIGLETGHCKVFMESEDVPRKLDISVLGSYEELYRRLANMFGIERSALLSRILYQDANGIVKHAGDEPFSDFIKTTRRLTILMDSSSDNTGR